jgi:hypothetical protein
VAIAAAVTAAPASAQSGKRICGWYVEQGGNPSGGVAPARHVFVAKVNRGDSRACDDVINRLTSASNRIPQTTARYRIAGDYCETTGRWLGRNPVDICLQMPADWGQGPNYTSWTYATHTFIGNYYNPQ